MTSVCVVGAGPAGITATKSLHQCGLDVSCYETSTAIGGHWVIDNPTGRSAAYTSLTINTTKWMSRFSDYEMPKEWPELPSHAQVREWLEGYVDAFDCRTCFHLNHDVIEARPDNDGRWRVSVATEDGIVVRRFDALVAASGNYWHPRMPTLDGDFGGHVLHAQHYRTPSMPIETRGKRVIVVGLGNTGCELAMEIAKSGAERTYLSVRSGTWIVPKFTQTPAGPVPTARQAQLSHPQDTVPALFRALPRRLRESLFNAIAKAMLKRMFGEPMARLTRAGLPEPPQNPLAKRPTVADGLVDALENGLISARPAIDRVDATGVRFVGGERVDADIIVCATGYHLSFPYLDQSVLDTTNDDAHLFLGTMHPHRHNLFVVGASRPTGGFWPVAEAQALFVAELLAGRYVLPTQRRIDADVGPILNRDSFSPAFYGLALREELRRGARRARRRVKRSAESPQPTVV